MVSDRVTSLDNLDTKDEYTKAFHGLLSTMLSVSANQSVSQPKTILYCYDYLWKNDPAVVERLRFCINILHFEFLSSLSDDAMSCSFQQRVTASEE